MIHDITMRLREEARKAATTPPPAPLTAPDPATAELLTDIGIAQVLDAKASIEKWLQAVEAEALRRIEAGQMPGWKAQRKLGARQWKDLDTLPRAVCGVEMIAPAQRGIGQVEADLTKAILAGALKPSDYPPGADMLLGGDAGERAKNGPPTKQQAKAVAVLILQGLVHQKPQAPKPVRDGALDGLDALES